MLLISHRGNMNGPQPARENSPGYIDRAILRGYHVLIDVWGLPNGLYLGEDAPQYLVHPTYLTQRKPGLWCRARNRGAVHHLMTLGAHVIFQEADVMSFTSEGYIWTFAGYELGPKSVVYLPEKMQHQLVQGCAGLCSNYVDHYRRLLSGHQHMDVDT